MKRLTLWLLCSVACANARDLGLFDFKARLIEQGERLSARRSLEQDVGQEQMTLDYCEGVKEDNAQFGTNCTCDIFSDGVVGLNCLDACLYCDENGLSCGNLTYTSNITDSFQIGPDVANTFHYDGAGGIFGNVTFQARNCDDNMNCEECLVFVNSTQCNSCAVCANGEGVTVDCENIVVGSSFSICENTASPIPGVFQGFGYDVASCAELPPPEPPSNDNCTEAVMLQIGDTVTGTAYGATSDSVPLCSLTENRAEGVWYKFEGNGSPVLVSTCVDALNQSSTAETYVSVYQGSACGQLACVPAFYQALTCGGSWYGGSSFSMETNSTVTYYVHISDRYGGYPSQFSMSVMAYLEPTNNQCSTAGDIAVDADPVRGTTRRVASGAQTTPCGWGVYDGSGMAWYRVTPTKNSTLRASTCSGGTSAMSTGLTVVSGDCDGQMCLAESVPYSYNQGCGDGGAMVDFDVVADGSSYSIFVWGTMLGDLGFFELGIRTLTPPENDRCEAAVKIAVGDSNITGTLFDATSSVDEQNITCTTPYDGSGGGVWYSFNGTGDIVTATSCSVDYSHYISMYEGDCGGSLKCVASPSSMAVKGCNAFSGKTSPVQTIEGVTYYILVTNSGGLAGGDFDLSLTTVVPPPNDECQVAIEVVPDESTVVGNTENAIYDEFLFECNYGTSRSPALWYRVQGSGAMMRADTCSNSTNFDSVISILEGPCGSNPICIVSNDDTCGLSSSVIWQTELGVEYYIRVAGLGDGQGGEFGLRVSTFEAAPNDDCSGAIELTTGVAVSGSMDGASPGDATPCFDNNSTPGLWYYIDGVGSALEISACDPSSPTTSLGGMQIFQGSTCSSELACVPFYSTYECSANAKFLAEDGERYYILLFGFPGGGSDGNSDFTITATEIETVANDVCEGATSIDGTGLSVTGSTEFSLPDNTTCGQSYFYNSFPPGVWYTVQGTGMPMVASTCSSELNFDTSIGVFSGRCDDLQCIGFGTYGYDGTCTESSFGSSRVIFQTQTNTTYYVLVAGGYQTVGDFGLTISEVDVPSNDLCTSATRIVPDKGTMVGSTVNASSFASVSNTGNTTSSLCSSYPTSPGVWYSLNGTGDAYSVSTCSNETNFDTAISVSYGSCGQLQCVTSVAYNDNSCPFPASRAFISTEVGMEYFILVQGASDSSRGDFGLTVSLLDVPPNDICSGAFRIVPDNGTIFGSTEEATDSGELGCSFGTTDMAADDDNFNNNNNNNNNNGEDEVTSPFPQGPRSPDLWYVVEGTGGVLIASTCGEGTTYDSQIEILESVNGTCATLACVVTNDDACSMASQVEWFASLGTTYFIRVFGFSESRGSFELSVTTPPPPSEASDVCETAISILPSIPVYSSTVDATPDPLLTACGEAASVVSAGVWYMLLGDGKTYRATTCSPRTDFDTQISVFTGTCDGDNIASMGLMECVNGNDQFCGDQAEVEWTTEPGVRYYIVVHGHLTSSGNFELLVLPTTSSPFDDDAISMVGPVEQAIDEGV